MEGGHEIKKELNMNIMVDLETLSSQPDAAIVAIGACVFSDNGEDVEENSGVRATYYAIVNGHDAQLSGGHIDARTVSWWAQQSEEARIIFSAPSPVSLSQALAGFTNFCDRYGPAVVWGNGASFDCVILRRSYGRLGLEAPWTYHNERCYRTLKNLRLDIPMLSYGTRHNALDDAIAQARHAERILSSLRCK